MLVLKELRPWERAVQEHGMVTTLEKLDRILRYGLSPGHKIQL